MWWNLKHKMLIVDVHSVRPGFVTLWELVILSSVLGVEVPAAGIPALCIRVPSPAAGWIEKYII
jgi:hypothetical protein